MDKSGALQRVIGTFLPKVVLGNATKFAINQGNKNLECLLIARLPSDQKLADGL